MDRPLVKIFCLFRQLLNFLFKEKMLENNLLYPKNAKIVGKGKPIKLYI